jgi:DNA-binding response OmpR family regulator
MDGLEVCREIQKEDWIPVLMLTARTDEADKVAGFAVGADDYLTKPFSPRELVARVRAVFRRTDIGPGQSDVIRAGDVTLDIPRMQAKVGNRGVELTSTEFELLAMMMRQPGRVFTRGQLLDAIRADQVESFDRAIDAHIKNLRRKLEPDAHSPRYVLTVYGVGYKFADI